MQPSEVSDTTQPQDLLHNELSLTTTVKHTTRLDKPSAYRRQLLKVTLASPADARNAHCLAQTLHNSKHAFVRDHVPINPTLITHEQCLIRYNLRTELKRRKAVGETNLTIKHDRIVTKATHNSSPAPARPTTA